MSRTIVVGVDGSACADGAVRRAVELASGLGDSIVRELALAGLLEERAVTVLGVEGWPACGTPPEALRHHRLDGASLAERIGERLRARTAP